MRIRRTTTGGLTYEASFTKAPSEKTLAALDAVAQAAVRHAQNEGLPTPDEAALRREVLTSVRELIAKDTRSGEMARWSPAALMSELRIGRNLACSLLEELEANGELVRYHGAPGLWWLPAPASQPVGRGYALPLSQKEASALLRLLDTFLLTHRLRVQKLGDLTILREVRSRLMGGPL